MCGIVGYMVKISNNKYQDFFQQSLYVDALRGMHGTGLFQVHERTGEINGIKRGLTATDFLDSKKVEEHLRKLSSSCIAVGHNRHATIGAHSNENAHPFFHGNIHLVHNGSLRSHHTLPDNKDFVVDSEMIAHSINKIGVEETLKLLNGSFALVWYDSAKKTLNMVRNSERPLFIGKNKDNTHILFASEAGMLRWIASRNGLELDTVEMVPDGKLHTFSFKEGMNEKEILTEVKDVEFYELPKSNYSYHNPNAGGYHPNVILNKLKLSVDQKVTASFQTREIQGNSTYSKYTGVLSDDPWTPCYVMTNQILTLNEDYRLKVSGVKGTLQDMNNIEIILSGMKIRKVNNILHIGRDGKVTTQHSRSDDDDIKWLPGPNGGDITTNEMKKHLKDGCSNCGCRLEIWDADTIAWAPGNAPICEDCAPIISKQITLTYGKKH